MMCSYALEDNMGENRCSDGWNLNDGDVADVMCWFHSNLQIDVRKCTYSKAERKKNAQLQIHLGNA